MGMMDQKASQAVQRAEEKFLLFPTAKGQVNKKSSFAKVWNAFSSLRRIQVAKMKSLKYILLQIRKTKQNKTLTIKKTNSSK